MFESTKAGLLAEVSGAQRDERVAAARRILAARQRTRAADRAARIAAERGIHEARWAADPPPS